MSHELLTLIPETVMKFASGQALFVEHLSEP